MRPIVCTCSKLNEKLAHVNTKPWKYFKGCFPVSCSFQDTEVQQMKSSSPDSHVVRPNGLTSCVCQRFAECQWRFCWFGPGGKRPRSQLPTCQTRIERKIFCSSGPAGLFGPCLPPLCIYLARLMKNVGVSTQLWSVPGMFSIFYPCTEKTHQGVCTLL